MLRRAHAVVNLVRHAVLVQVFHLPQDRCDPDAAGNQDVLAPDLAETEQIDRVRDLQRTTDAHRVVHEVRAPTGLLHAPDGDLVGLQLRWHTQQRIGIAMHAVHIVHDDDDVRAAGKGGQARAIDGRKLEVLDLRGDLLHRDHPDRNGIGVAHRNTSFTSGRSPGASASTITPM